MLPRPWHCTARPGPQVKQRAIVSRWRSAIAQAVQRVFQPPAGRLEAGHQLLHHPITIPESWNINSSWQRMPLSKKPRTGERKREGVRGEREGERGREMERDGE
ncbi:MAG: hypothetical protein K2J62_11585 [Bacteroidales bacterium]|nr:hypothetical protein [Bacteroidales bacterium]